MSLILNAMALTDYIEHLRAKPESTRRYIALSTSGAITLVVALGWLVAFVSSDSLALDRGRGATPSLAQATEGTAKDVSNLLGAASAFQTAVNENSTIRVVETHASSTLESPQSGEQTVIPF